MNNLIIGVAIGASVVKAIEILRSKEKTTEEIVREAWYLSKHSNSVGSMVGCVKHPGNGLLMWSDGKLRCYKCGMEEFSPADVEYEAVK